MSLGVPTQSEDPLSRCRSIYLGTSIFKPKVKKFDENKISLNLLQETIAERYPIDGSPYANGIVTWLSVFPSGIQMEHPSADDPDTINSLYFYPIRSIVYCGAVRFTNLQDENRPYRFVPLDTQAADLADFVKNPPLFVVFLKAIDSTTKTQVIECNVHVVDTKKTAMRLVDNCQKAYDPEKISVDTFYLKYNYVPVVYFLKDVLPNGKNRMVVKSYDMKGYFYATENNSIEVCQLLDYEPHKSDLTKFNDKMVKPKKNTKPSSYEVSSYERLENLSDNSPSSSNNYPDPFQPSDDLIRVESRIDPSTGQNVYVRYIKEKSGERKFYDVHAFLNNDEHDEEASMNTNEKPKVLVRQEKTPSPIIFEKYIKKKAPQVIIKEIHVHEPAPPPIKIVQKLERNPQYPMPLQMPPQNAHQYPHHYPKQILPDEMPIGMNYNAGFLQNQPRPKKVFQNQPPAPQQPQLGFHQQARLNNFQPPVRLYDEYPPPNPYSLYSNFTRHPSAPLYPSNNNNINQYMMPMQHGYRNPGVSYCDGNDCCLYENYKLQRSYSDLFREPRRLKSYKETRRNYDLDDKYAKYKKQSRSESRKKYEAHDLEYSSAPRKAGPMPNEPAHTKSFPGNQ